MKRRDFVKTATLATGSLAIPFSLKANSEKIKIGIVGTGWWGTDLLIDPILSTGQFDIVGLCDVDSAALERASKRIVDAGKSKPELFKAHRELYAMPGLQSVVIATPTHWHALQFIDACDAGLHVFLEKPISYDIREGQAMLKAWKKAGTTVQVDFPRIMFDTNDVVRDYIQSGELGRVMQVQANINNNEGPMVLKDIPETLDYETFCGPVETQKYLCRNNGNKINWRAQFAFSRGVMVDWGIHYIHNIRRVLDLDLPDEVSAIGGITSDYERDNPDHLDVRFDFDGLPVYWSHKAWGFRSPLPEHRIGVYYYGDKGTLFAGDLGWEVYPKGGSEVLKKGSVTFNPGAPENEKLYYKTFTDMFEEFASGIRSGSNDGISNPLDDAFLTTSTVNLGDIAYRSRSHLEIERESINIKNSQMAQDMLKRAYRDPYKHPYSG